MEKREGKEWKGGRWGRRRDETRVEYGGEGEKRKEGRAGEEKRREERAEERWAVTTHVGLSWEERVKGRRGGRR